MKALYYKKAILILLIIFVSGNYLFAAEATKRVTKSFNIKSDTKIEVDNQFGNVIIKKWDQNVLELKVNIQVESKNDSRVQKMLDDIEIEITDRISSGSLSIVTEIDGNNQNSNFSINYEITMPDTNPLKLSNKFGNVYMGSYSGDLDVDVRFGQYQAEDLENATIRIEFSNAMCEIETLKSGELDIRYSKLTIDEVGDLEIESQFSDLEIANAGSLELDGRYGSFEIGSVKSLTGEIQFAGLNIENLAETIVLDTRHGNGIQIEKISNKMKKVDIEGEFSTINLSMESGTRSQLLFLLDFGNLKANGQGINFTKVIKEQSHSEYEGYLGSKDATATVKVDTKHGNVRFDVE
jgi:hypothetical protein